MNLIEAIQERCDYIREDAIPAKGRQGIWYHKDVRP